MNRPFSVLPLLFLFGINSVAQVIFYENFDNNGMPASFTLIDNDGLTPAASVNYFTNAWIVRSDFDSPSDSVAASTSWYNPPGIADDWMITPPITIGMHAELSWYARAVDPDFPDGYQVLISTTGTSINDFSDTLFSVSAENSFWTEHTVDLMAAGYANTTIYVAFRNNSDDMFILFVDDIKVRTVPVKDVRIVDIDIPEASCGLTATEPINITIKNSGRQAVSGFPLSYQINNNTPVTEIYPDTLYPGETTAYTFLQTANFSQKNIVYEVRAYSGLTGDGDSSNDTTVTLTTINVGSAIIDVTGYTTSFESDTERLGWQVEDVNADGKTWTIRGQAFDGNYSYMYLYDVNNAANDWLYSTCLDLSADSAYTINFFYKVGKSQGVVYPEKFSVHLGTDQIHSAMTQLIYDFGSVNNDTYEEAALAFKPQISGTHYIGFKCYSDADQFYLAIDQPTIKILLPPVASFTYSVSGLTVAFTAPAGNNMFNNLTWDFGDDSTKSMSGSGLLYTYAQYGTYYVCLTVSNLAGTDTYCDSVRVEPTGIAAKNGELLLISPNPAHDKLLLHATIQQEVLVSINDMMGKIIWQQKLPSLSPLYAIDLSLFAEGFYFLSLQHQGAVFQKQFIVKR